MSQVEQDLDYSLWTMYLKECRVKGVKPSMSDYSIFLQEADMDRADNYDG